MPESIQLLPSSTEFIWASNQLLLSSVELIPESYPNHCSHLCTDPIIVRNNLIDECITSVDDREQQLVYLTLTISLVDSIITCSTCIHIHDYQGDIHNRVSLQH
jgi:hypothetical protein